MYSFDKPLVQGILLKRYKRFLVDVLLDTGEQVTAHCTNTGSLKSCLIPGNPVILSYHPHPGRKTAYTWEMIKINDGWVGVNTALSNKLVHMALQKGLLPEFKTFDRIRPEYRIGNSRLDFLLENDKEKMLVEVKNVTYKEGKYALFPDAPTLRGLKHLEELVKAQDEGYRVAMLYTVSRMDTQVFAPAKEIHPPYAEALQNAVEKGLEIYPYQLYFSPEKVEFKGLLPYEFD